MEYNIYSFDQLTTQQLYDMMAHRFEVFVLGRGDIYRDFDYFDQKAKHLIATDENGKIQGYVRLLPGKCFWPSLRQAGRPLPWAGCRTGTPRLCILG